MTNKLTRYLAPQKRDIPHNLLNNPLTNTENIICALKTQNGFLISATVKNKLFAKKIVILLKLSHSPGSQPTPGLVVRMIYMYM